MIKQLIGVEIGFRYFADLCRPLSGLPFLLIFARETSAKMKHLCNMNPSIIICLPLMLFSCRHPHQPPTDQNKIPGYELVKDWLQLPKEYLLGNPSGIAVDTSQNIIVFHRSSKKWPLLFPFSESLILENTISVLDRNTGKILQSWGNGLFIMPHSLTVDKDNNIWVTDVGLQQVLKFTHEGTLLMKLGQEKIAGDDSAHFNRPTDIALAGDGSFYVSDSRIQVFDPAGNFLKEWKMGTLEKYTR